MRDWLRTARLLVSVGWEIGPGLFLLYIGYSAVAVIVPVLLAIGLRPLVDGIVFERSSSVAFGASLAGLALLLMVTTPVVYRWTMVRMRERSIMVIQRRLLVLTTRAPRLAHFERPEFWDRLQELKRSTQQLVTGMMTMVLGPIILVELVVTAVLLGRLVPWLLLIPVVAMPAAWLARRAEALRRSADLAVAADRRTAQHLFGLAASAAPGMEIRLYGLQEELVRRHRATWSTMHRRLDRALTGAVAVTSGSWLLFAAAYVFAVGLVLRESLAGRATPGDVALTLALSTAVVFAASQLSELAGSLFAVRTVSEHYHWLEAEAAPVAGGGVVPSSMSSGISLEHVSFGYGDGSRLALTDVSMTLPAGSVVAVVGENGAGKTTLVKLLCGMYAPSSGEVLVDGVPLSSLDLAAYRERVTAGFQDFMRLELLTRESVGVGSLPLLSSGPAVTSSLEAANATFVERLPQGVETQLGLSWSGGVELSGGEWQKLALARSFVRPEPLLAVLDEPTAALDPQTEHALFEQVAASSRADGRITLLISHRFSTVRMADLIVVLAGGRVQEQGTHDALMASGGLYAELYSLQAHAYR